MTALEDPVRVLLLPSVPYGPQWQLHAAGQHPIPTMPDALLRLHGIECDRLDPGPWPWNPLGRLHPFYRAFDPLRLLRALLRHRRYELVVSGNDAAAFALVTARRLLRLRMKVLIWDFSPDSGWRPRGFAQDRTLPFIDGVLALNQIQARSIPDRWGAHVPVTVVGHWVDTEFFQPAATPEAGYVLAVGDDEGRDYDTLLRAAAGLSAPVRVRSGRPLGDGVTVLPRMPAPALRDLYAAASLVVVPLRPDTRNASGISTILEAGAMGKAVVVSDSDGIREFVRHEETGLVVPAHDPAAMRAAIERLLAEPETRRRLGQGGRRFIESVAAPSVFTPRLAAAYRAYARPPSSPGP